MWFGISVTHFLSFPQKTWHKSVYFSMIKFTVIPKKTIWYATIWKNWCFGQFHYSKTKKKTLTLSQFSLVACFFEGTREYISDLGQKKTDCLRKMCGYVPARYSGKQVSSSLYEATFSQYLINLVKLTLDGTMGPKKM